MTFCLKKQLAMSKYYHVSSSLFQVNILNLWALIMLNKTMPHVYLNVYKETLGTHCYLPQLSPESQRFPLNFRL